MVLGDQWGCPRLKGQWRHEVVTKWERIVGKGNPIPQWVVVGPKAWQSWCTSGSAE